MVKPYYIHGCSLYCICGQILLHLWLVLPLWLIFITFMVFITFMGDTRRLSISTDSSENYSSGFFVFTEPV